MHQMLDGVFITTFHIKCDTNAASSENDQMGVSCTSFVLVIIDMCLLDCVMGIQGLKYNDSQLRY